VCAPLNANELVLPAQRVELQELLYLLSRLQARTKMSESVLAFMLKLESDKDGETQLISIFCHDNL